MSHKVRILDGGGTGNELNIDKDGALLTTTSGIVPFGSPQIIAPLRQYLTDDGLITGSSNMLVDGSTTNVDFFITAHPTYDTYVTNLSIAIVDANMSYPKFGNLAALVNGVEVYYESEKTGTTLLHDSIKSNFEFIRFMQQSPPIGSQANAYIMSNVVGSSEGLLLFLDLTKVLPPNGIRLSVGTNQIFSLKIRDDITLMDQMDGIVNGYYRLPA